MAVCVQEELATYLEERGRYTPSSSARAGVYVFWAFVGPTRVRNWPLNDLLDIDAREALYALTITDFELGNRDSTLLTRGTPSSELFVKTEPLRAIAPVLR